MPADNAILRKLTLLDLPAAIELSRGAGWNQTSEDWETLIELAPETCLGIETAGRLVSTATLVCYGKQLAWIGMVLTSVSHRGHGYAKQLLTETLRLADELGISSVKLDATDQGQPLYEKLGFRGEQVVERWEGRGPFPDCSEAVSNRLTDVHLQNDRYAFGADRSALLHRLSKPQAIFSGETAFLLTRPGRTDTYLGPCVAGSITEARQLFQAALASNKGTYFYWDILPSNSQAVSLARELEFTPKRKLLRMVRGKDLRSEEAHVYGLAGFEFG